MHYNPLSVIISLISAVIGLVLFIYFWIPMLMFILIIIGITVIIDLISRTVTGKPFFKNTVRIVKFHRSSDYKKSQHNSLLDDNTIETRLDDKQ